MNRHSRENGTILHLALVADSFADLVRKRNPLLGIVARIVICMPLLSLCHA